MSFHVLGIQLAMLEVLQSTPYTPIFPPPLPNADSPLASTSCDSALTECDDLNKAGQKPYIDRLKERYLLLSGLPEELCPPSRETSPSAEARIGTLSLRIRNACALRLPLELALTCVGVKGGDWVGIPVSGEDQDAREYRLPATEEEWFEWESALNKERDDRREEREATECRKNIEKWSQGVQEDPFLDNHQVPDLIQERHYLTTEAFALSDLNGNHEEDQCITTRVPSEGWPKQLLREQSEPVERNSLPLPLAPAPDLLPGFCDSFSPLGSTPLPDDLEQQPPIQDDSPLSPSFDVGDTNISTPPKKKPNTEPVLQLSSPISPPRSLRSLSAAQSTMIPTSRKRPHGDEVDAANIADSVNQASGTPHSLKRARTMVQPITPKSVERPRGSQEFNSSQLDPKRLPTLEALLDRTVRKGSSRKGTPSSRGKLQGKVVGGLAISPSLQRTPSSPLPEVSLSQPTYSMFRPEFHSTQHRRLSVPPSPSQRLTTTQQIGPQDMPRGTASSGIGPFQSQFDVEGRVDEIRAFLEADAWDVET